ncbi:hypothetical protein KUV57_12105 [Epibacterium sp. DP7N7-1]|nr:hypothetical protein [Epibacterium sp. DP7N7-1]
MRIARSIFAAIFWAYFGAGMFGGLVMQAAVPAMNGLGVAYYAATWPAFLHCARSDVTSCNPLTLPPPWIGKHLFDLDEQVQEGA